MATTVAILEAVLRADTKAFDAALGKSETKMQKAGKVAGMAGLAIAGGLAVGATIAVKKAIDLGETMNKTTVVFEDQADAVVKWSETTAKSIGTSQQAALEGASSFGLMFTQIGFGTDQAANLSKQMVTLAADLGSFNNASQPEIQEAMAAAFRGEYDSLQKFVPVINAANVQARAMADTGKENVKQLTAQEKAQATYRIMMEGTTKAQGDFARTSGSLANQQKIMRAQLDDMAAQLGQVLIPVLTQVVALLLRFAEFLKENPKLTKAVVVALAALAAALLAASVAQMALNLAVLANPYVAVAVAVLALAAAMVVLYKKVDFFRKHWQLMLLSLGLAPVVIATVAKAIIRHMDTIKAAFQAVKEKAQQVWPVVAAAIRVTLAPLLVFISAVRTAISVFHDLGSAIRSLPDVPSLPSLPDLNPFRAAGGPVRAGGSYIVGERGPELFKPSGSGTIVSNADLARQIAPVMRALWQSGREWFGAGGFPQIRVGGGSSRMGYTQGGRFVSLRPSIARGLLGGDDLSEQVAVHELAHAAQTMRLLRANQPLAEWGAFLFQQFAARRIVRGAGGQHAFNYGHKTRDLIQKVLGGTFGMKDPWGFLLHRQFRPQKMDDGGWLPPRSTTMVSNRTNKWEPVGPPGGGTTIIVQNHGLISSPDQVVNLLRNAVARWERSNGKAAFG